MGRVKNGTRGKGGMVLAVHPNSRKAGQVMKKIAHVDRVSASKKLRETKDAAFRAQVEWFQNELDKHEKVPCSHEFDALIGRYIQRNDTEIDQLSAESRGASSKEAVKAGSLRRLAADETEKYSTGGIVVPNILCISGLKGVKGWGSDVIDLVKIPTKKFKKLDLAGAKFGGACHHTLDCPAKASKRTAEEMAVDPEKPEQ